MKRPLIFLFLFCSLSISIYAANDNNVYKSLCDFLLSEGLPSDSSVTLKDSSIYIEELLIGGNDFSKPFGVYLFNKKGVFDSTDYLLIKENEKYWIYKDNIILPIISDLLKINKTSPNLLCDKACFEYIKKISALKEPLLRVGQKRGMFIFIDDSQNDKCKK